MKSKISIFYIQITSTIRFKEYGFKTPTIEPYDNVELDMYEKYIFNVLTDEENKSYNYSVLVENVLKYLPENIKSKIYSKQINVFSIEPLLCLIELYVDVKCKESISNKFKGDMFDVTCHNKDMFALLLEGIIHTSFIDFYMNNKEVVENSLK